MSAPVLIAATMLAGAANAQPAPAAAPDPLGPALAAKPGGLTPEAAGAAARTAPSVRGKQAELQAAAARVDQAFVAYFPKVTVTATYTRLSDATNDLSGGGNFVSATNPGVLKGGGTCPPAVGGTNCITDQNDALVGSGAIAFPSPLNSYSVVAALLVPISDYVLRISQGYATASHAEKARQLEVEAEALAKSADAKVAFYNWVKAKAQVVVATEAIAQAKAHVVDAQKRLEVEVGSRADILRLEAQVASAEQVEAESIAFAEVAEAQLRIAIRAPDGKPLEIGVDVMAEPGAPPTESLATLQKDALAKRLEIRALDETQYSLKEAESVARAGYLPRLDAFGDVTVANPNQRFFPQQARWDTTWEAGVRLTWVINDSFTASGATAEAKAKTLSVSEQKAALADALRLEVATAYADVKKAPRTIEAADRGLVAALEAQRVRTELFRAGRASAVDLVDAETEVTRARLKRIDARVGLLVAKTRLAHATGRDVR